MSALRRHGALKPRTISPTPKLRKITVPAVSFCRVSLVDTRHIVLVRVVDPVYIADV